MNLMNYFECVSACLHMRLHVSRSFPKFAYKTLSMNEAHKRLPSLLCHLSISMQHKSVDL